jgi:3',5'-cyclic AMP phosphodiesterase CpdA
MNRRAASITVGAALVWMLVVPAAGAMPLAATVLPASRTAPTRSAPVTVVAAGDIACDPRNSLFDNGWGSGKWCRANAVDKVIQAVDPSVVLALGDEQYDDGRLKAFEQSYALSWGQQLGITYAVPGNHEYYASPTAYGYFTYFGTHAGPTDNGWYTAAIGDWRLIALNSNCGIVGCTAGTPQYKWLRHVLVHEPSACTVAIMHHPLLSSGPHGDDETHARPLWQLLYRYGVDLALVGHDHDYERFAPVNALGSRDTTHGIREFVVGTGGAEHYAITTVHRYSQVHNATTFGVLQLSLGHGRYAWRFDPALGASFTDSGSATCHGAP